ncbi:L,D-transpeptidase family protein [Pseudodesulfovibrio senegalensis]|nr:L,D-transpeptidase family protein [Pseudodesulfovibrio senegalensis]
MALCCCPAFADDGWRPTLTSHQWVPERLLAIDKDDQRLFVLQHESPIKAVMELPCTTGQAQGDKMVRGDLRTPEGTYFLGRRIQRPLGWDLYGNIAYSLNYPNPVDRIKGKTGSGIWLHGRGKALTPRDTRGCIALKASDLESLGSDLYPGMPVVVAEDVSWKPDSGTEGKLAAELVQEVRNWARDWESRSGKFFVHFDPVAFTLSGSGDFAAYKSHKESIFRSTPWLHVMVDNVRAIAGPDYWVTCFDQFYRSPSLAQTVGKRLYWMRTAKGGWVVVGREYTRPQQDLAPQYFKVMDKRIRPVIRKWAAAWQDADMESYLSFYGTDAVQGDYRGAEAIREYKNALWEEKAPVKVTVDDVKIFPDSKGLRVDFVQEYEDASGYADRGHKTLVLAPVGDGWKIEREEWRRL